MIIKSIKNTYIAYWYFDIRLAQANTLPLSNNKKKFSIITVKRNEE